MQAPGTTPQTEAPAVAPVARQAPTATEMFEAARRSRSELRNQQGNLQGERRRLQEELQNARTSNPSDVKGLEARIAALDARIADVDKQLAVADARVATTAAVPGVVVDERSPGPDIPAEAVLLGGLGMLMVVLLPVSIGYARRLWRRGGQATPSPLPADLAERMASIERGVEAVAIEVERLGEGQRFVTQLLAESNRRGERQALPLERGRVEER